MGLNLLQDLFGGSNTQTQSTSTPSNFNPFTTSLGGSVNTLGNNLAGGLPQYNGNLAASLSPGANSILSSLMGMNSSGGSAGNTNSTLANLIGGGNLPGQPNTNPAISQAITAAQLPTMENLTQTLTKDLPGYFTANGQMIASPGGGNGGSSAFDSAAALATQSASNAMAQIAGNITGTALTSGEQQQTAALQLSQQEIQSSVSNLQAQALPQMIAQQGIQNGLQLFQENLQGMLQVLQTLGGIAQPVLGNTQQSTSNTESTGGIIPGVTNLFKSNGSGGGSGQV